MMYTFEITVAGCSTNCSHCYVDGGPMPPMPIEEYRLCLNKLVPALNMLEPGSDISIAPGHEPLAHRDAVEIMRLTHTMAPDYYPDSHFDTPTSGIAFMARRDKEELISALRSIGSDRLMITLHGGRDIHNEIVKNPAGYDTVLKTADFFHERGFEIVCNVMLSKPLIDDFDTVSAAMRAHHVSKAYMTIPLYQPVERIRAHQKYRAQRQDCYRLRGRMGEFSIDEDAFFRTVENWSEKNFAARVAEHGFDYAAAEAECPNWAFYNIGQKLDFYYGNAGMRTQYLGDLHTMSSEDIYAAIMSHKANYDYSSFYDVPSLPHAREVVRRVSPIETDYVYCCAATCLYSWFDRLGIKTILLEKQRTL